MCFEDHSVVVFFTVIFNFFEMRYVDHNQDKWCKVPH